MMGAEEFGFGSVAMIAEGCSSVKGGRLDLQEVPHLMNIKDRLPVSPIIFVEKCAVSLRGGNNYLVQGFMVSGSIVVFAYGPKTGAAFLRFFAFKVRVLRNGLLRYKL